MEGSQNMMHESRFFALYYCGFSSIQIKMPFYSVFTARLVFDGLIKFLAELSNVSQMSTRGSLADLFFGA